MYSTTIPNLCGRGSEWAISGAAWDWGPSSRALVYDGTDDYAGLDQSIISGYPFTILVQFQTANSTAASRCIFSQSNSTDSVHKLGLRLNSSHQPQAFVGTTTGTFTEAANDGAWHTLGIIAEADGTCYPVYDGEIGASFAGGTFPTLDLSTLGAIRSASNTEFFPGSIARLIVVDRALDVIELQNIIRDPAAWSQPPRLELLFEPEVEEVPFFPILHPGGWPGQLVSRSHPQAHHLEGWWPLTHSVDANGARAILGNVEAAPDSASSLLTDLLAYYPFTELSGTAGDVHGSNHLTDVNTVGTAAGKVGTGRSFLAASNEHFNGGDVLDFEKDAPRTIAFWINPTDIAAVREVVSKKDASGANGWSVYAAVGATQGPALQLRGASGRDLVVRSNTVLSTGVLTHVAITFDGDYTTGGSVTIYLNGSAVSTTTDQNELIAGDTNLNAGNLLVGARSQTTPANFFDGILDELGIWDRELTSAEVLELFNAGNQGRSYSYLAGGGAVTYESEGRFGGRLRFDGTTSRILYPNSPGHFHFADGESITIAAWITPDTSDRRNVIVRQDGDGFAQVNYSFASGGTGFPNRLDFFFRTQESGGITHVYRANEDYIQFGVEQHVAITLTFGDVANTIQLFYNGEPVDGSFHFGDGAGTVFSGVGDLLIGQHSSADRFDGAIADLRIYRTLADETLIRNIIGRPWDAMMEPLLMYAANTGTASCVFGGVTMSGTATAEAAGGFIVDLISYWKCDESSSGSALLDAWGPNDLAQNNMPAATTGKINGGRDLERSNTQYFLRSPPTGLKFGDEDFTLSAWIKIESMPSTSTAVLYHQQTSGTPSYQIRLENDGRIGFIIYDGVSNKSLHIDDALSIDQWFHVIAWHDSVNNEVGLFIGTILGVTLEETDTHITGVDNSSSSYFAVGTQGITTFFDGVVDEIGIWGRVLSMEERNALYNGGNGLPFEEFGQALFAGSAALSFAGVETAGAGEFTPGDKTAAAALTFAGLETSATATFDPPVFAASAAQTFGAVASTATATFDSGTFTAASQQTFGGLETSATGETVTPTWTAAAALTFAAFDTSATAIYDDVVFMAAGAFQFQRVLSTGTGTFVAGRIASAQMTFGGLATSAAATHQVPVSTGMAAVAFGGVDTTAAGQTTVPVYSGTAAATFGGLSMSASAAYSLPTRTGTGQLNMPAVDFNGVAAVERPVYVGGGAFEFGGLGMTGQALGLPQQVLTGAGQFMFPGPSMHGAVLHIPPTWTGEAAMTFGGVIVRGRSLPRRVVSFHAGPSRLHGHALLGSEA